MVAYDLASGGVSSCCGGVDGGGGTENITSPKCLNLRDIFNTV